MITVNTYDRLEYISFKEKILLISKQRFPWCTYNKKQIYLEMSLMHNMFFNLNI
jgi:hypothetical protein